MRRLAIAFTLLFTSAISLSAQQTRTLTLEYEVTLFASADASSEARTTLAVGTVVEVISELDAWMAVEAPDGTVGWVSKEALEGRGQAPRTTPAPPPQSSPPPTPPASRPGATPPPPPRPDAPPARRPGAPSSTSGGGEQAQTWNDQGGLYGTGGWGRLAVASVDGGTPAGELAFAKMLGRSIEWRGMVGFDHRKEGMVAGADNVPFTDVAFTTSVRDDNPVSSLTIGGTLSYYVLEPTPEAPIGIHVGATGHWRDFFSASHFGSASYTTLMYGGEGGVFFRRSAGGVVRGAVQFGKIRYKFLDEEFTENVVNLLAGVEPKIGGVILSAFFIRRDNENMMQVGLTFR